MGLWFRGIMFALHAKGPGFDSLRVHLFLQFYLNCIVLFHLKSQNFFSGQKFTLMNARMGFLFVVFKSGNEHLVISVPVRSLVRIIFAYYTHVSRKNNWPG